jgi:hypothetical protein
VRYRDFRKTNPYFSSLPGFRRLKITPKEGNIFAFVEFEDIHTSTHALSTYNGTLLGSYPMRIEYAKSKMGEKRTQDTAHDIH